MSEAGGIVDSNGKDLPEGLDTFKIWLDLSWGFSVGNWRSMADDSQPSSSLRALCYYEGCCPFLAYHAPFNLPLVYFRPLSAVRLLVDLDC